MVEDLVSCVLDAKLPTGFPWTRSLKPQRPIKRTAAISDKLDSSGAAKERSWPVRTLNCAWKPKHFRMRKPQKLHTRGHSAVEVARLKWVSSSSVRAIMHDTRLIEKEYVNGE